ncbi:hypothetical protein DPMN_138423 [Dreissena polymorpha]|uniref:Uncharacterized protein n=1 Tax=Dreissena polymorpha TaxID=45954 RepID=A0A9D4G734_DREPO|nr:hypothetical protein DPMN_138423 [Dreissena polymorpha]
MSPPDDPVEVERWSEYVEKYVNNEDTATEETQGDAQQETCVLKEKCTASS